MTNDYAVYVLIRNDLPSLNPGKMAAQVHHAGVQMMSKYHNHALVKSYLKQGKAGGADGFNTTLALGANLDTMTKVYTTMLSSTKMLKGMVVDPTYPFVVPNMEIAALCFPNATVGKILTDGQVAMTREEITCAWFLGCRHDIQFRSLFNDLELYP